MVSIQPFIDLGWHTVPLKGKLERLDDGTKTVPNFEKQWRERYTETKNKTATPLGGTITGKCSNIIAIDCDNTVTYELFRQLDPEYTAVFVSHGKGYEAGTFIYQYDEELNESFIARDHDISLDVYSNDGFVYLPTKANSTKVTWEGLPAICVMPDTVKLLLKQLQKKNKKTVEAYVKSQYGTHLAPLLKQFVGGGGEFMPALFKIVTPRDFREEEQYVKHSYLHPNNIPEGRGSEYLSKISAILGCDESVNEELYMECMMAVNALFSHPLDDVRLDKTICTPMLEGNARIDGEPIWTYDKNWDDQRYSMTTKYGTILDIGFDKDRLGYYAIDLSNEDVKLFAKDTELLSYLEAVTTTPPAKKILKQKLPMISIRTDPSKDFGFCDNNEPQVLGFNTFRATAELTIIKNPAPYKKYYRRPETILKYLKSLVPDDDTRNYLLGFIKRKLTTFEYSPAVLFFLGIQGSGKDTFIDILANIMPGIARPNSKQFLEIYNNWIVDSYFVQLDEYGNQLNRIQDKEEALGKIKAISGKPVVDVRMMRTNSFQYNHSATFIMTANKNPLMLEDGDRRMFLIETPNKLKNEPWFSSDVWDKLFDEVKDFCYYLATEVPMLSKSDYINPPDTDHKHILIADSMYAANKIAYAIKNDMKIYMKALADTHNVQEVVNSISKGYILDSHLGDLYDELTDFKGDIKSLRKVLKKEGVHPTSVSHNGVRDYKYYIGEQNDDFAPIDGF